MLFHGLLITTLSGKIDGAVASHGAGGAYFRSLGTPTNPNTSRQILIRSAANSAYLNWVDLSAEQRAAWEAYARSIRRINRIGVARSHSGWNEFVRAFTYRHYAEAELSIGLTTNLSGPPTGPTVFGVAPACTLIAGTDTINFGVPEQSGTWWDDEEAAWLLELGGVRTAPGVVEFEPFPTTRNTCKGPWQLAGAVRGQASGNIEVTLTRNIVAGERIFTRSRVTSMASGLSTIVYGVYICPP